MLFAWLAGCAVAPAPPASSTCVLPAERPTLIAVLFFGRAIIGRIPLSDREWAEFVTQIATPNFPDGFTVFDGEGRWRNPRTGQVARERTKILLVATKETPDVAQRLSAVIDAYKPASISSR
jgi:hypothetical protein